MAAHWDTGSQDQPHDLSVMDTGKDVSDLEKSTSDNEKAVHGDGLGASSVPQDIQADHNEEINMFDSQDGKSFKTLSRVDALLAMLCNQFGLGVLGLPSALRDVGLIPGLFALIGFGLVSCYGGLLLHRFYRRYPHVVNIVDMVGVVGGKWWAGLTGTALVFQLILTCASTAVTLSVAFNFISNHSVCTVGFIAIGCLICWVTCVPRTAKFVSWSGPPTVVSIVAAALAVMISLGISSPGKAPDGWDAEIKLFVNPGFRASFNVCLKIIFAYCGNVTFPTFMAEMKDASTDFPWALYGLFGISMGFYVTLAVAIYCLAGEYTTSPALGSAPTLAARVAYGLVIPAVMTAGLANGHIGAKYLYVQILRRLKRVDQATKNTTLSWGIWISCISATWILAFIISNVIPIFDSIVAISSATTYAWFTYGIAAILSLYINKGHYFDSPKEIAKFIFNILLIGFTFLLNGAGIWASILEMLDLFKAGGVKGVFDCGNNAIF
ncbi:hypothetical protein ACHAPT_012088 [Fusarium lateritium]